VAVWQECFRVLKPGGHLLSFGGTRTFDLISLGIRMAGFENRDTVASFFGTTVLSWCYGSGFPKSLNISKAIDKAAGAEREVIGTVKGMGKQNPEWNGTAQGRAENSFKPEYNKTTSATDAAKKWEGWGTALKPSWEPILVFRKPLEEATVAAQVLATGTGGLNIDATRITTADNLNGGAYSGGERPNSAMGRWPANLILSYPEDSYTLRDVVTAQELRDLAEWMDANAKL